MTWPIIAHLGEAVPGRDGDVFVRLWTHRWVRDALLEGYSPFFTDQLFFPEGVSLATHNIAWFNIALWLPLQAFLGEATSYSIVYLLILALNGWAGFLLVFEYTRSKLPAFIGGLIIAFWPLILSHHHQPNIIIIAWVILSMLFLKRTIEQSRFRDSLLLTVSLALIGISRWQMLIIGGVLIVAYGLFLITQPGRFNRRNLLLIGFAALLSLLIMLPLLLPGIKAFVLEPNAGDLFDVQEDLSVDLLGLILPSRYHPLWGSIFRSTYINLFRSAHYFTTFIGYSVLLLVLFGLIRKWREARMWLVLSLVLLVLAFGSNLRIGGVPYLPLPYQFLKDISIVRLIRHPLRFGIVLAIPIAVMAGYGALAIQVHPRLKEATARAILMIAIGLILFEYVVTFRMMPLRVPAWIHELAAEEGDFAVVDMPLAYRRDNEQYMYNQTVHGKSIVGGKIARVPDSAYAFIHEISMLEQSLNEELPSDGVFTSAAQLSELSENNIRYLILHRRLLGDGVTEAWKTWLDITPVHEDDELVVYQTASPEPEAVYVFDSPYGAIGVSNFAVTPTIVTQASFIEATIDWFKPEPAESPLDVCFSAVSEDDARTKLACFPISESVSFADWPPNAELEADYVVPMDPYLESGRYKIEIHLIQESGQPLTEDNLMIGEVSFSALPRVVLDNAEVDPVAIWGDVISLNAFDVHEETSTGTKVDLRWQARARMGDSYKVFAHLIDADSGEIVAQHDFIPRQWTYPTIWWEQHEIITDTFDISYTLPETGHYQLWLGLYEEQSLERLPVSVSRGVTVSPSRDAVMLHEYGP